MDRCRFLKELSSFMDNQLRGERKLMIEAHLKECAICSGELARLKALSEKLKCWHLPELGPGFEGSVVKEAVRRDLERGAVKMKKKTLAILVPSGALAGILVIAFLGHIYVQRGSQAKMRDSLNYSGEQFNPAAFSMKSDGSSYSYRVLEAKTGYDSESSVSNAEIREKLSPGAYTQDYGAGNGSVILIQPTLPATGQEEKIIRLAQLSLEVEDGKDTYNRAVKICDQAGGYISASNLYKNPDATEAGTIIMRIPKDKFVAVLDKLKELGKIENFNTSSQDVTSQYNNLKARLDAAMVVYNKMLEALQKRQVTIPEAMRLESELTPVMQRIEELKNAIEQLNNSISFTTINLSFRESDVSGKALKEIKNGIRRSFLNVAISSVKFFVKAIPAVVAAICWLAIIAVAALLVKAFVIRLFKRG
ncbi:MAG: DUF4349 domain-containing protein [Candidatus Omnitrophica bacterium]|nr:DUF4349 domain-containing protein [Candidatus Omnitrophota bacterium]